MNLTIGSRFQRPGSQAVLFVSKAALARNEFAGLWSHIDRENVEKWFMFKLQEIEKKA